jgi:hypothetical protein
MKRFVLVLFLTSLLLSGYAQTDSSLQVRLDSFFHLNHLKEIDRVLDYTYPKLFTIVPREQMHEVMKSTFDNDEMTVTMDSLKLVKTYPMLNTEEGSFVQMEYTIIMRMQFKQTDSTDNPEQMATITSLLSLKYGEGNARYDSIQKQIVILVKSPLLAIRDRISPQWTFINFKKDDMITPMLLSKDILDKLSSQQ